MPDPAESGRLELEFTVEPFVPARPGPHVTAAIEAAEGLGLEVDVGPFGTTVRGPAAAVLDGAGRIVREAMRHGATRVSLQVVRPDS
jgi:uncharacterized protein YqgV (UPF0045/DUF77 family)